MRDREKKESGGRGKGWIKCNFDTGASVTAFPKKYSANQSPTATSFKTASGEMIPSYGAMKISGKDERGVRRVLNGSATEVQKVLVSASKLHSKGYCSWLWEGGGELIPVDSPVYHAMKGAYDNMIINFGAKGLIPVDEENGVYNFYINPEEGTEEFIEVEVEDPGEDAAAVEREESDAEWDKAPPQTKEEVEQVKVILPTTPKVCSRVTFETRTVPKKVTWTEETKKLPRPKDKKEINAFEVDPESVPTFEEGSSGSGGRDGEALVESRKAKVGWEPPQPTEDERKEHEVSGHAVYRSWCEECCKALGATQQHRRVNHEKDLLPTISMDYFYMEDKEDAKPGLVAIDRDTGMMMATSIERKGMLEATPQKLLTRFIELLGYKEVVLKSDGERPLVRMKTEAAKAAKGLRKAINEESPQGDSRSNGHAEVAVKEVKWRIRAIQLMLAKKFNADIPEGHPLLTWVPRYAAEQANRYRVGHDGRTPEERRTGKKWIKPLPTFGERVLIKPAGKGRRGDQARMVEARFVGAHNRFGSVLGMTKDGVVVGTGYHKLPEDRQWGVLEDDLKGSPWNVRDFELKDKRQVEVVVVQPAIADAGMQQGPDGGELQAEGVEPHAGMPSGSEPNTREEKPKRAFAVRRDMLEKYGKSIGCDGCLSIGRGAGFQQIQHSNECRSRIRARIQEDADAEQERIKRQRDAEAAEEQRRAEKRASEGEDGGSPKGARLETAEEEGEMVEEPTSPKRKGGEQGVVDVDDLARQTEELEDHVKEGIAMLAQIMDCNEAARMVSEIGAMDLIEVFSPPRFNREVKRFGLRQGVAIDLEEMKPDGEERWDLDREEDVQQVKELIAKEEPLLVTSSPPCTTFTPLRNLSNQKRDPETVEEEEDLGRERLKKAIAFCRQQRSQGGFFLHEHPKVSSSWQEPYVKELMDEEDIYVVQSPMCRFGMKAKDQNGVEGFVRKETLWMTNSKAIADELRGTCENILKGKEIHRHVHLIGGQRAKAAQVYPKELVVAVLRGLKKEMHQRKWLSALEEKVGGPCPDDYNEWEAQVTAEEEQFIDDVSGLPLDAEGVRAARAEELRWVKGVQVYERVPRRLAVEKGVRPLGLKWVDVNKGDSGQKKYRSRIVTKEIKRSKGPDEQLGGETVFASTPPIEAVMTLLSLQVPNVADVLACGTCHMPTLWARPRGKSL